MTGYGRNTHRKTPDRNSPNKAMCRTQSQRFEDIRSSSNTAIKSQWDPSCCNRCAGSQGIQRSWNTVKLTASVVGDYDAIHAIFDGQFHVFWGVHFIFINNKHALYDISILDLPPLSQI